jgi:hypothetical protein
MQKELEQYKDHVMDPETQIMLNKPLPHPDKSLEKEHEGFLMTLIGKLGSGELDPLNAQTLYHREVYDALGEAEKEKADLTAVNLMSIIRQIEKLWKTEKKPTFQLQNLVETVWQMKSGFEEEHGDVYVI